MSVTAAPEAGQPSRRGPLAHLTVLDLTQHLAGPFASQILGDLGARVIKVEPPAGDPTRRIGPHFADGDSAYFLSANRNKESVVIDLRVPSGQAALRALAAKADVVLENFRPGTLSRLGLDHDQLMAANPRAVLCSITGFGQDGPYRDRPAFDIIVQALAGGMSLTGEPGGKPVRSGLPIGDVCAGMYGAVGVLAGLLEVAVTGKGAHVDVSMLDTQISLLSYVASYYLASGQIAGPQGRGHMSIPTYRALTCGDGREIVVAANTERFWHGLAGALGHPELVDDPRFADNESRRAHRDELDRLLESAAGALSTSDALERLAEAGVPAAPINRIDEALTDPQVAHRDMVVTTHGRGAGITAVGNPVKFPSGRDEFRAAPHLGADTEHVLRTVADLDDTAIAELVETHAITLGPPGP